MSDPIAKGHAAIAMMLEAGGPGSGPQGGSGGSSSATKSAGKAATKAASTHSVKLPPNPSKMTITHASKAMEQMGMKLGPGKPSIVGGKFVTNYSVSMPDGSTKTMSTDEMKSLIYSGASK